MDSKLKSTADYKQMSIEAYPILSANISKGTFPPKKLKIVSNNLDLMNC